MFSIKDHPLAGRIELSFCVLSTKKKVTTVNLIRIRVTGGEYVQRVTRFIVFTVCSVNMYSVQIGFHIN